MLLLILYDMMLLILQRIFHTKSYKFSIFVIILNVIYIFLESSEVYLKMLIYDLQM